MDFIDHLLRGEYNGPLWENMVLSQENGPCGWRDHMSSAEMSNCTLSLPYEYCILRPIKVA